MDQPGRREKRRTLDSVYLRKRAKQIFVALLRFFRAVFERLRAFCRTLGPILLAAICRLPAILKKIGLGLWHLIRQIPHFLAQIPQIMRAFPIYWNRGKEALFTRYTVLRRFQHRAKTVARESRRNNFPESNRKIVQFVLFIVGMLPMCRALLREKVRMDRHRNVKTDKRKTRLTRQLHLPKNRGKLVLLFALAALLITGLTVFFARFAIGTAVYYDNEEIAITGNTFSAHAAVSEVKRVSKKTLGKEYVAPTGKITYKTRLTPRKDLSTKLELEEKLAQSEGGVAYGYSLYINDEYIGTTPYQGTLESLIEQIKKLYVTDDTISVALSETVRVESGFVSVDQIKNLGEIAEMLTETKSSEKVYTVVKGDTWNKIAKKYDMTGTQLGELNPGYNKDKIIEGDQLLISAAVPRFSVNVVERQHYTNDIPYEITYVDDNTLYQGDYKVETRGEYGEEDVVAEVSYVNGVETERKVLSTVRLSDPKAEVQRRGTKKRPVSAASGSFRWPVSGRISSYFGYRNTGIRGASTNHMGIDITCSYGATICAADGGTVESAGWWGAGGYTVVINHGNGLKTWYEHNSSLLVRAGQKVYKGQAIARAGRTGVASGVHCHFGVQKNGAYVNPLKYLR